MKRRELLGGSIEIEKKVGPRRSSARGTISPAPGGAIRSLTWSGIGAATTDEARELAAAIVEVADAVDAEPEPEPR